mmetsp:Transcript_18723/g.31451  ORF Transcript_18723/g.31451 Transcript_18723/m.31451 type:complete len:314 (-) Transcript_18723:1128-2069(-)
MHGIMLRQDVVHTVLTVHTVIEHAARLHAAELERRILAHHLRGGGALQHHGLRGAHVHYPGARCLLTSQASQVCALGKKGVGSLLKVVQLDGKSVGRTSGHTRGGAHHGHTRGGVGAIIKLVLCAGGAHAVVVNVAVDGQIHGVEGGDGAVEGSTGFSGVNGEGDLDRGGVRAAAGGHGARGDGVVPIRQSPHSEPWEVLTLDIGTVVDLVLVGVRGRGGLVHKRGDLENSGTKIHHTARNGVGYAQEGVDGLHGERVGGATSDVTDGIDGVHRERMAGAGAGAHREGAGGKHLRGRGEFEHRGAPVDRVLEE